MGKGLEKDPVVKELVLLAGDVQLGQLQALLSTHVLGVGGAGGKWRALGTRWGEGRSPIPAPGPQDGHGSISGEGGDKALLTCSKSPM